VSPLKIKISSKNVRDKPTNTPRHQTQHAHPQYSIDCASIDISQKALGTLPEDGNVMPKHVGATILINKLNE
jgi:hypothetical protein